MSSAARKHEPEVEQEGAVLDSVATEYATRGARGAKSGRPNLKMVSPLRAERASRGVFALIITGVLVAGMVLILVLNTSLAQGAFTVSELQGQQASLSQQEQTLSEVVAAAAAPEALERSARALGMVPSESPVFLRLPGGRVIGRAKAAPGGTKALPALATPADATTAEAVDNGKGDLPVSPGADYDPAAADAAAMQAAAANDPALRDLASSGSSAGSAAIAAAAKSIANSARNGEDAMWTDATAAVASGDSGLVAVPVR